MRLYFDYAASTPVDPKVVGAMSPYFSKKYGNPGSLHSFGQEALAAIDRARETLAKAVHGTFREIVFTGSATEANNLAVRGVVEGSRKFLSPGVRPRVVVSAVEHESVLEAAHAAEGEADVEYLSVHRNGAVDVRALASLLDERTVLVSILAVSNETGAIEPIERIGKIVRSRRSSGVFPLFHTDASQAFQFLDCNANAFGVDLMTISGHKIYGPKGIGALYVREELLRKNFLVPFVVGGGQEFGLRAGTENVPLIVGFQKAVELTLKFREKEGRRIQALKERFVRGVRAMVSGAEVNGPAVRDGIPHIVNLYFPGRASEEMFVKLDLSGIAISAGSACTARAALPSYVLQAMGYSRTRAASSIRVSFGRPTTRKEIDTALKVIKMVMKK